MTEVVVIPNCLCGHGVWRHVAESRQCKSRACGCTTYRPKEAAQCENRAPNSDDGYCRCALAAGHEGRHRCPHGDGWATR